MRDTIRRIATGEPWPWGQIGVLLVGIVGLLVLVRIVSMIWSGLRLYEFRLARVGEDLRTEYGLLTRVTATIPLRRVQTLTIREAPLQRLVKRMSVRVETAGGHGAPEAGPKKPREWLAPIVRRSAVPALVREVLPGFDMEGLDWHPLHPRAFRRALKPALIIGTAMTLPLFGMFGWRAILVLPFTLAWMTVVAWKQVQRTQWTVTDDAVVFRSGWLWRNVTIAPVVKIQTVECTESPFDRRAVMAGVRVDTAGASERSHRVAIPYLARETAKSPARAPLGAGRADDVPLVDHSGLRSGQCAGSVFQSGFASRADSRASSSVHRSRPRGSEPCRRPAPIPSTR